VTSAPGLEVKENMKGYRLLRSGKGTGKEHLQQQQGVEGGGPKQKETLSGAGLDKGGGVKVRPVKRRKKNKKRYQ